MSKLPGFREFLYFKELSWKNHYYYLLRKCYNTKGYLPNKLGLVEDEVLMVETIVALIDIVKYIIGTGIGLYEKKQQKEVVRQIKGKIDKLELGMERSNEIREMILRALEQLMENNKKNRTRFGRRLDLYMMYANGVGVYDKNVNIDTICDQIQEMGTELLRYYDGDEEPKADFKDRLAKKLWINEGWLKTEDDTKVFGSTENHYNSLRELIEDRKGAVVSEFKKIYLVKVGETKEIRLIVKINDFCYRFLDVIVDLESDGGEGWGQIINFVLFLKCVYERNVGIIQPGIHTIPVAALKAINDGKDFPCNYVSDKVIANQRSMVHIVNDIVDDDMEIKKYEGWEEAIRNLNRAKEEIRSNPSFYNWFGEDYRKLSL